MQLPAAAPIHRLSVSTRPSLQNSAYSGQHGGSLPVFWGRGRQVMRLPCKQAHAGALPADSTNFNCGENEIQASLISSASAGATPTPATSLCSKPS